MKKKILWLVDHLGYNGAMHGAGMYYLNTIPALDKDRYETVLCVLREKEPLLEMFRGKGIDVVHLGRGKFDPRTLTDLFALAGKRGTQLIHAHGYGSANFGRLAGMLRGIPVVVHAHDDDRYYPVYQMLADRFLGRYTDAAIAVSESVRRSCINTRKFREEKTFTLHNGIPLGNFLPPEEERVREEKRRLGIPPDARVFGTVAKLRVEKGTRYLIESAAKVMAAVPGSILLIVGDGVLRDELTDLSRTLGIAEKTIFAGFRSDIPTVLSMIDVFAVPSLTEGSPLALLEAMAMGKKIVATNVGGIAEIMEDGKTGLLVPAKDPLALAEKIISLFERNDMAQALATNAREEAGKYDLSFHAEKISKHYDELISARAGS